MYRKFAFSYKHKGKKLTIRSVLSNTKRALELGDLIMTIVDGPVLVTTSVYGFTAEAMADLSSIPTEEMADGT